MIRKLSFAFIILIGLSGCSKSSNRSGCDTNQVCDAGFATLGAQFVNSAGASITVKDVTVINMRTNTAVVAKNVLDPGFSPDTYFIATDSNKDEFSSAGDDIKITATSTATNKTVSTILKISGGSCNCHIKQISGPKDIVID